MAAASPSRPSDAGPAGDAGDERSGAARVLDALDRWARQSPDAVAVSAADGEFTFPQLHSEVEVLAGALTSAGAGPGSSVALCLGRSRLLVAAFLAVWRIGATAVPIDDRHPADRIGFELRDAGCGFVLGDAVPSGSAPRSARPVPLPGTGAAPSGDAERTAPRPDDCAYIIYTSGSTGRPKGVEITYEGLGTFLTALATLGLTPGGVGVNAVSPAFDGWLWCTLLYLTSGQGVAFVDPTGLDGVTDSFGERLAALRPRTVCLTPSLLAACGDELPMTTEVLVVAGERCPPGLLDRFAAGRRVLNVYGPTEATIAATWADTARGDDPSTIGRALPGYRVHVLDEALAPVPAGTIGEAYVAGPALARGYRNLPLLTASRFLPDPSAGDGSRMYRTGDLVREREDGGLEYHGRLDDQVKVRGFRTELGEIERVALEVAGLRSAAAFLTEAGDAVGLAVVAGGTLLPHPELTEKIRAHCAERLPEYMKPAAILVVDVLPTTTFGKLDRVALAAAASEAVAAASDAAVSGRAPTTDQERRVCDVWSEVLERRVEDVDANFFDIGGHSLLAAKAISELRARTGLRLSMRHLLAHPTAAGLAEEVDRLTAASAANAGTRAPAARS